ncbi:PREDICTED: putative cysteine proteinase CG12163 [Rhagoletis zephyria]|uniref:putative cysteine proteinase CG12163 n=1 Tax=Rhagoletis zephyria TaxID=28612 RepID=UPI0008116B11|nr:PREDICTED: putative cysteine proteinase CG12163 [Rhagoletis zephyria]
MRLTVGSTATIVALSLLSVLVAGQDASAVEEEQPQPVSEEPVKFVHVLNPGEREYLSPNLIGVQNIAMTFLPLSMNFVNIIDAFREIVDGVRYEILLNAVDTKANDADVICRIVIIEKPWLRTEWGDKVRELRTSNCTSEDDHLTEQAARSKALNDKYTRNALFNGGTRNELNDDDMSKLESQILPMPFSTNGLKRRETSTSDTTTSTSATAGTTTTTSTTTTPATPATEQLSTEAAERIEDATTTAPTSTLNVHDEDNAESTTSLPVLTQDEMKWLDDFLSVGAVSFEQTQRERLEAAEHAAGGHNDNDATVESAAAASNYVQQEQQQQLEKDGDEGQVLEVDGELATADTSAPEQTHARAKRSSGLAGGVSNLENKDAEQRLQASLDKLSSGDEGPNYRISQIFSATTQVVSGTLTKIDAELIEENGEKIRCNVKIWSQPWLPNGIEVTFKCPNKDLVKRRHSRSVEHLEKKTHKKRNHHSLDKTEHLFSKFQIKYNRRYHTAMEHQMRLRIFKQNLQTIQELNRNEMGSAKYGITEFADLTSTEYKQRTGLWQRSVDKPSKNALAMIPNVELPKEFDWREKGVISNVKNQGMCGSCWAFSVTGNVEGLHAVKTGKLEEYSEQELLDCDTTDSACNGGLMDNAYEAIQHIGGLELESEYPYEGHKDQCQFNKSMAHVKVKGGIDLPKNESAIAQWLITNGPVSIGINANAMQFYRGGVSHPWKALCSKKNLDHGVLIVGYGVSDYPMFKKTLPYWIVKNSWGPKWGEQGYYRVYRGDNTCGVSEMASSAVLDD